MKKPLKILLIAAGVLAALVLIAAVAVPPVAKNYIEKHDRELLGRSIRMERLRMNILTGRLRVKGLRIGGAEDSTTFFALDTLDMRLRLWPLLSNRVVVKHIHLRGPDVKVYQRGTALSFDDLIERFAADSTAGPEEPSKPWEIAINDISIRDGHLFYKDLVLGATWGLNDIGLQIPGVYFGGEKTDVGAVLNFAQGGSLSTEVAYDIASSQFDIALKLDALTLDGLLPYFRQTLDVGQVQGRLWADVRLRGDAEHLLSMRADGVASLAGFSLSDNELRPVAGIDTLGIRLTEADLGERRLLFDRVYVGGFTLPIELTEHGNNLAALVKPAPEQETTRTEETASAERRVPAEETTARREESAPGTASPAPTLRIAELEVAGGNVILRDKTLESEFEYVLSDIRMRSRDFDPSQRNRLLIDARMQRKGEAKLRWEGTLNDLNNQNITLLLSNIDLRDFSPYSEHYTAYPLTGGNLSFRSQNVIRNRYLDGTNHLDVYEPKAGRKRREIDPEMHIPLKLGLYVLKDKKGHVKMDLPVGGNLDSPEFSYRKIVLKAIGNVLLKVVTAPFSFLSGGGKEHLSYIGVDAAQYAFSSEQYAAFDRIAGMLRDKPGLQIALTQRIDLQRALPAQAVRVLQMEYHNHLAARDTSAGKPRLSLLEYEKLQQIDIRTPQVAAFADSLLAAQGTAAHGMSPQAKALALYGDRARESLLRGMEARDKALSDYMLSTHGLQAPAFAVQRADSAAVSAYTGRDRYTIALGAEGERIEIEPQESHLLDPAVLKDDAPETAPSNPAAGTAETDTPKTAAAPVPESDSPEGPAAETAERDTPKTAAAPVPEADSPGGPTAETAERDTPKTAAAPVPEADSPTGPAAGTTETPTEM